MVPGDLVLYESHSVLHGRPFPLNGTFMANVFIHFEPVGPMYGQVEYNGDLPPYVIPGSEEEANWRQSNPQGHKLSSVMAFNTGSTDAHHFASLGQAEELQRALDANEEMINVRDKNGWMPLHEATRSGDVEVVKLLLDRGADVNARTGTTAQGGSALYYAHIYHGKDHPIVPLLKEREAKVFVPEEL
jgi:prolyl 4-hydroxylase